MQQYQVKNKQSILQLSPAQTPQLLNIKIIWTGMKTININSVIKWFKIYIP